MAKFNLDIAVPPEQRTIRNVPANDWASFVEPIVLEGGDVILQAVFTIKRAYADTDTVSTSVQKIINDVTTSAGVVTPSLVTFWFAPADTLKMLTANLFDVQLWVQRGSSVYIRTVISGTISASKDVTNATTFLDPGTTIAITPGGTISGAPGTTEQLTATVRDSGGNILPVTAMWASSNPAIAGIDASGMVFFYSNGSATITASVPAYSLSTTASLTCVDPGFVTPTTNDVLAWDGTKYAPVHTLVMSGSVTTLETIVNNTTGAIFSAISSTPSSGSRNWDLMVFGDGTLSLRALSDNGAASAGVFTVNKTGGSSTVAPTVSKISFATEVHLNGALLSDGAYDIGLAGSNKFRDFFLSRNAYLTGNIVAAQGNFSDVTTVAMGASTGDALFVQSNTQPAITFEGATSTMLATIKSDNSTKDLLFYVNGGGALGLQLVHDLTAIFNGTITTFGAPAAKFRATASSAAAAIFLMNGSGGVAHLNWSIGKDTSENLLFTPSTANDGVTFTTPTATFEASGDLRLLGAIRSPFFAASTLTYSGATGAFVGTGSGAIGASLVYGMVYGAGGSTTDHAFFDHAANPQLYINTNGVQILGSLNWLTDNATDLGGSGVNRPRDVFVARNVVLGGALSTGDPGSGIGAIKLGKIITATVTAVTSSYLEAMVDGVLVKIQLAT